MSEIFRSTRWEEGWKNFRSRVSMSANADRQNLRQFPFRQRKEGCPNAPQSVKSSNRSWPQANAVTFRSPELLTASNSITKPPLHSITRCSNPFGRHCPVDELLSRKLSAREAPTVASRQSVSTDNRHHLEVITAFRYSTRPLRDPPKIHLGPP